MSIRKTTERDTLTLYLEGKLDANSAAGLDEEIRQIPPETKKLVLDLAKLNYISSAGLRAILTAQKKMNRQGVMLIRHVNEPVMEVFDITGFSDILVIE